MKVYKCDGCECKDSESICPNTEYIIVSDNSIKDIKNHENELDTLKIYGKLILGKDLTNNIIENWAKSKHYYKKHIKKLSTSVFKVSAMKKILNDYDSSGMVNKDLKTGKALLNLSYSLSKQGAKTFVFDKGCEDSLRILISSRNNSLSKFTDSNVQDTTKTKLIGLLQKVFHDMGTDYKPVEITSGFRTNKRQAEIMAGMLPNNKMLDLYSGVSKPYIELVQELYNTGEKKKVESYNKKFDYWCLALTHDQYNALGVTSTNPYIIYKSNADLCEALLNKIFDEKICMPSYHPSGYAFDLSTNTSTTSKASALYNKNKQMIKENYVHFTLN